MLSLYYKIPCQAYYYLGLRLQIWSLNLLNSIIVFSKGSLPLHLQC
uniref:Uncharacterized protein n=1 Tax=Rhizophora mucronata TaxID=61149 RepID=A0A2P2JQC0_RHIMU